MYWPVTVCFHAQVIAPLRNYVKARVGSFLASLFFFNCDAHSRLFKTRSVSVCVFSLVLPAFVLGYSVS